MITNDLQVLHRTASTHKQFPGKAATSIFLKHEKIIGNVLRSSISGNALLSIKGEEVLVRTHVPLKAGTHVALQVKDISPVPTLKFIGEIPPKLLAPNLSGILAAVKGNTWKTIIDTTLHSNFSQDEKIKLLDLLETLTGGLYKKTSSDLLKTLISMSGINLEAKIKKAINNQASMMDMRQLIESDLKGLLATLIGPGAKGRHHLKTLWTALDTIQHLNREGMEAGRKIYLPIPMQLPDGIFSVAELCLQLPPGDEDPAERKIKQGHVLKATFLLEMSRLGPIRAEINLCDRTVEGVFLVAEKQTKAILDAQLISLKDVLRDKGFTINQIGCFIKDPQTVAEPLWQDIVQVAKGSLCLIG